MYLLSVAALVIATLSAWFSMLVWRRPPPSPPESSNDVVVPVYQRPSWSRNNDRSPRGLPVGTSLPDGTLALFVRSECSSCVGLIRFAAAEAQYRGVDDQLVVLGEDVRKLATATAEMKVIVRAHRPPDQPELPFVAFVRKGNFTMARSVSHPADIVSWLDHIGRSRGE